MIHERQFSRAGGVRSLYRACVMRAVRVKEPGAGNRWPDDPVVDMVLRAAETPTTLAGTPELQGVLTEFLAALAPHSAAAGLFRLATDLSFGNAATIALPRLSEIDQADWIREGAPFPVVRGAASGVSMSPYKIGTIVPLSNEMMRSSSAEAVVRQALMDNIGPSLDRSLFDDQPGVPGLRPPGLLHGVTESDKSTETNKSEAMVADLETLIAALAPYGGNGNIAIVASAKHAVRFVMRGFMGDRSPYPMLIHAGPSTALIAVAAAALAVAIDPPSIDAGGEVLLHMEDTNPLPIVDDGGTVASPVRSTWQTDSVGLRFRLPVSWVLRAPAVSWLMPTW
jgi:hypothetical protein